MVMRHPPDDSVKAGRPAWNNCGEQLSKCELDTRQLFKECERKYNTNHVGYIRNVKKVIPSRQLPCGMSPELFDPPGDGEHPDVYGARHSVAKELCNSCFFFTECEAQLIASSADVEASHRWESFQVSGIVAGRPVGFITRRPGRPKKNVEG